MIDISLREATLFTLERHHLIDRAPKEDAIEVVDDILGLNAQGALNYNISLWNRVSGLENDFISRALNEDRSLVRSWLMRDTVHIVPSTSFHTLRRALRSSLIREWNRWTVKTGRKEDSSSWEPHYAGILEALESGPQTMAEIVHQAGRSGEDDRATISRIVREMSLTGLVCHATTKGPWYHNAEHAFARVDRWLPEPSNDITEREAGARLAEMYLEAYGPASVSDFSYWSGMRVREAAPIFEQISGSTEEVRIEGKQVEGQSTIVVFVPKTTSPTPGWTITTYERQVMSLQDYLSERGYTVTVDEAESIEQALMKYTPSPTVTT